MAKIKSLLHQVAKDELFLQLRTPLIQLDRAELELLVRELPDETRYILYCELRDCYGDEDDN